MLLDSSSQWPQQPAWQGDKGDGRVGNWQHLEEHRSASSALNTFSPAEFVVSSLKIQNDLKFVSTPSLNIIHYVKAINFFNGWLVIERL